MTDNFWKIFPHGVIIKPQGNSNHELQEHEKIGISAINVDESGLGVNWNVDLRVLNSVSQ